MNVYEQAEALLPQLADAYAKGASISALAREHDLRREAIGTVLVQHGYAPSSPERDRVLEYVRTNPGLSVDDLAIRLDISKSSVSRYLRGVPERRLVVSRKQTDQSKFSDADMANALRVAYRQLGERRSKGLSRMQYKKLTEDKNDVPAASTFIRRYGTWSAACERAGINASKARRPSYEQTWSDDDIIEAVADFIEETGTTTYHAYVAWAQEHGRPSGPLLVQRWGSWSIARREAINQMDAPVDSTTDEHVA
jgi:hypothetical protein